MRNFMVLFVAFGILSLTGIASAGVLATAPVQGTFTGQTGMYCDIVNLGKGMANVKIEIKDYSNVVSSSSDFPIAPGKAASLLDSTNGAYCVFTVPGSTKKFRAAAVYYNAGAYTMALEAH